jgi:PIN domain nuclease of toxin-antitoxin system
VPVVADIAAAVTDTHALLYHAAGSARLVGKRAAVHLAACELRQALVYVPAAVIWEVTLLARLSRVTLHRPVRTFFDDLFSNPCYQPMDLTPAQVYDASALRFTRDPFDGLICAAARSLDLPLITRDHVIQTSGVVRVLW